MTAMDNESTPVQEAPDRLQQYRAKRKAGQTREPFGSGPVATGRLFVVQKHAATMMHYDLRLEVGGALRSWAVPKGISMDPMEKRLAVYVEDHPLEYADFEGMIPEGNYGAGAVIVWDQGTWTPREPFEEGFENGKLLFQLHGYKLHGVWTLVKLKKTEKEWLLIKERDAWATTDEEANIPESSVFTGRQVEELRDGVDPAEPIREDLGEGGAPKREVDPRKVELTLAQTRDKPFTDPNWLFEIKYDGYRLLASREGTQPLLLSRQGHDLTATFPEIAKALKIFPYESFILDGEVVVHDDKGLPSFQRLQKRGRLTKRLEIARAAVEYPAILYIFDLLAIEGYDLRGLPLRTRKEYLWRIAPEAGPLRYADHIEEIGEAFYEQAEQMGLEGIVAKRGDSKYVGGRTDDWIKLRLDRTDDYVVVGYTEPKGTRTGIGALHVGGYDGDQLVYAGRVGTGFTHQQLDEVYEKLRANEQEQPPCVGEHVPKGDDTHWVKPELVCEVRYKEATEVGMLRQPVFIRFRDDKPLEDCILPGTEPAFLKVGEVVDDTRPQVPFSNLDKVFWPEEGYTKGDLIEYYRAVSPWMLPYLENRPVVLTRYPDGIDGKSFFQKDSPQWTPEWVRREVVWSDDSDKATHYFVADDVETLLYIINLGSIPLHIWSSRMGSLESPDWCILDLDPKEAPFVHVVQVAQAIHELCDDIGLPCYVKTSGSSGLHVLVPLGGQCTYDQSKALGELLGRVTASRVPEIATTARALGDRKGRVYIDFVQNGHGKLLVSPLCVRPLPHAPVSMPLRWSDVTDDLTIEQFTIKTAPPILAERGEDPMRKVLTDKPNLSAMLERLAEKVD
jgi:bifunctional non-homologous end joining protein LigD